MRFGGAVRVRGGAKVRGGGAEGVRFGLLAITIAIECKLYSCVCSHYQNIQ